MDEILDYCAMTWGVTFPVLDKVKVNGGKAAPLYKALKRAEDAEGKAGPIIWNFEKFVLTPDGAGAPVPPAGEARRPGDRRGHRGGTCRRSRRRPAAQAASRRRLRRARAHTCRTICANASAGCAPETPYLPSMTKNGTPLMPYADRLRLVGAHRRQVAPAPQRLARGIRVETDVGREGDELVLAAEVAALGEVGGHQPLGESRAGDPAPSRSAAARAPSRCWCA